MRILLDMDGPLADFDQACWDLAEQLGLASDIPSADHQAHRFMTDHIARIGDDFQERTHW